VLADFSCTDPGSSGIAATDGCVGTVADGTAINTATLGSSARTRAASGTPTVDSGDPIDTSSLGTRTFTVTATDLSGNITTVTHAYEVVDTTGPTVRISTPADQAAYGIDQVVEAEYACTDQGGSGMDTCVGTVPFGDQVDTSGPGEQSFTVTGTDNVGNTTTLTHTYTVVDDPPPAADPVEVLPAAIVADPPPAPQPPPPRQPAPAAATPEPGVCVSGIPELSVQRGSPLTLVGPGTLTSEHEVWIDGVLTDISIVGSTLLVGTERLAPGPHEVAAACRGERILERSFSVFFGVGSTGTAGGLGGFFGIFIVFLSAGMMWRVGALSLAGLLGMRSRRDPTAVTAAVLLLVALGSMTFLTGGVASAAEDDNVRIQTTINERAVEGATSNDPVRLLPDEPTTIGLSVTNDGSDTLRVERVRMSGTSLGLTLIAYDIPVPLEVPAGGTREIDIPLVLFDLDRQATGLVPGTVSVYDDTGTVVATESFTLDIRGSATSVLGLFGMIILLSTTLSLVVISRHIANRTLPSSRFRRGLRFGLTGVGIGLTFVIALAVLRIAAPEGSIWVPFAVIPGAIGFVLGFISPGVLKIEEDEVDVARSTLLRLTQGEQAAISEPAVD
jgi:hypothetical protein